MKPASDLVHNDRGPGFTHFDSVACACKPTFAIGAKLIVDDCPDVVVTVTMIKIFRERVTEYFCEWWNNGDMKTASFEAWRLSRPR